MSTRARIAAVQSDETVTCINLYRDGHVDYAATCLSWHYDTAAKVKNLLKLGDLLDLGETPETSTRYTNGAMSVLYRSLPAFLNAPENEDFDYLYIFKDGQWNYMNLNE